MAAFFNQATLSYNGVVTRSNIAAGELLEALTVAKTALSDTYAVGGNETYVVSLVNTGTAPLTGITLTDDLGGYPFGESTVVPLAYVDGSARYYVNGVLQPAPAVTAGPPMTVSGLSVPAAGSAMLVYETQVTPFASPETGATVVNTVTVGGTAPVSAAATVTAAAGPVLSVSKAISPDPVMAGERVSYTFTLHNTGNAPADATDNAVITDVFDPRLSDLAVTFDGAPWSEGAQYAYDPDTGLFATAAGQITLPAATYTQDPDTGAWQTAPGVATLTVSGVIG
ncbi:MAG: hypothetical protein ACOYJY_04995 [Acutalibacteraceae bacterium]|jgi:uncharacterized repeat protein (TIGR01451 family)